MRFNILLFAVTVTMVASSCQSGSNDTGRRDGEMHHLTLVSAADRYTAWPAIARAADGSLLVAYTDSDEHMGPDGRIMAVRSVDEGQTWSEPFLIYDTPLDERESGLTQLRDGLLIVHTWSTKHTPKSYAAMGEGAYYPEIVAAWVDQVSLPAYEEAAPLAGAWVHRSTDGGRTWSEPARGPDTIHGGIELRDGGLLVASYKESRDFVTIHAADRWDGEWKKISSVHSPEPDSIRFGEPSLAQLPNGRIVLMMRVTTKPYNDSDDRCFLWSAYSDDGGESWSEPFETPLWGFPPHLLVLSDGRLLVTYGHRRSPFGQRAAVSADGINWDVGDEVVLRDDAPNLDLGYPASIELTDGRVLTVYYQSHPTDTLRPPAGPPPSRHKPDIVATIWSVPTGT